MRMLSHLHSESTVSYQQGSHLFSHSTIRCNRQPHENVSTPSLRIYSFVSAKVAFFSPSTIRFHPQPPENVISPSLRIYSFVSAKVASFFPFYYSLPPSTA